MDTRSSTSARQATPPASAPAMTTPTMKCPFHSSFQGGCRSHPRRRRELQQAQSLHPQTNPGIPRGSNRHPRAAVPAAEVVARQGDAHHTVAATAHQSNAKHHHRNGLRSCERDDPDRKQERNRPQEQEQERMCAIGYAHGKKSLTKNLMLLC